MWTNVFKIGGLHQISWFQFLPLDCDLKSVHDKSIKVDQKDAATLLVLSAHLQLQREGFLSSWTNSFVGPWDPSQGLHNPDEKIKLWLFLPGHHSAVTEKAQPAVSRLRVIASGYWIAPGDSEEVASALAQALRNRIERALRGYSYMRYGDVFSRYQPFSQNEELFRKDQPVVEFIFAATEEALFVHVQISQKHIRVLSSGDMERVLKYSSDRSLDRLPVIVSPHGMNGKLTGCYPSDVVKKLYLSSDKVRAPNGIVGLPLHASESSSCQLRGRNCYVEVTLGSLADSSSKMLSQIENFTKHHLGQSFGVSKAGDVGQNDQFSICERMFVYPTEAVIVPVIQASFARTSLKRFWLQNWIGPSLSSSSFFKNCFDLSSVGKADMNIGCGVEMNGFRSHHSYHSSSNSSSSSLSSSSSDSDYKTSGTGDLEADADSLPSRHSVLSSVDQSRNDGTREGSKLFRTVIPDSLGQVGRVLNPLTNDYDSIEATNSTLTRVGNQQHLQWCWDDDDKGLAMDIQALLSEFGDFGDFFENDALPFGEPPGTAESQALMFTAPDCADIGSSPGTSVMDASDQGLLPVGFPSFESFNPQPPAAMDDLLNKDLDVTKTVAATSQENNTVVPINSEFDHLIKAEARMTFAPEYGAVESPGVEFSASIFRSPYIPKSLKVETANSSSNNYVYSALPPPSPGFDGSDEKSSGAVYPKACTAWHDASGELEKYYTHVKSGEDQTVRRPDSFKNGNAARDSSPHITPYSGFNSNNSIKSGNARTSEGPLRVKNFVQSTRNVLATEIECLMFQAFMCRIRHTMLSSSSILPAGPRVLSESTNQNLQNIDSNIMVDNISSKSEPKKKDSSIPVRIAGNMEGGKLDGPLTAPVGVWRSVGVPKSGKPKTSSIEAYPSVSHNSFTEETMLSYGLRQPLQELIDSMALLVQQATSFVDVALDADCVDGPYGWLALDEQWRRGFCCGPSMAHAGCGGVLASCHSVDIAGVELIDPLSVDVQASTAIRLLQSDMKAALKTAFGALDGPLTVIDWCRGRNQFTDTGNAGDGFSAESMASASDCHDSSNSVTLSLSESVSPSPTSVTGSSNFKADRTRVEETNERRSNHESSQYESEQQLGSRLRPTLTVLPFPSILVGYQDDWLKTSTNSLHLWEKAPLEPYAMQKHMTYYVVCPDIDPLVNAAADFFHQLGTVYEACKLGTHSPLTAGNEMEIDSGKTLSSGFVTIECPQSMKIDSSGASILGSISDYFLSLSNGWDLDSFLKSLSKVLKSLKLGSCTTTTSEERNSGPCTVVYVVCPFPEPLAILRTVIESSVSIGSLIVASDTEKKSILQNQIGKALSQSANVDETFSTVLALSGFSVPKLVLQIVTVDAIFRVTSPSLNELVILKEISFTVYNKARRILRGSPSDIVPPSSLSGRSHSALMQMTSPVGGMWRESAGPRIAGSSLQREGELDAGLRPGIWDNSWQTSRTGLDSSRTGEALLQDDICCMFEPLFILAEPGSPERGVSLPLSGSLVSESSKLMLDDGTSGNVILNSASSPSSHLDALEADGSGSSKTLHSMHCCYGWTEDWRWLVCLWTDSRGELLDSYIYPFGGISSRQDTKGLQSLFAQILQQGCHILQTCVSDAGITKPRDFVITRIGCFFELECQEWQKALYSIGGSEVKKWSLQLRRFVPDGMSASSNGAALQQQEMSLIQERNLPSSPSPLYGQHSKASGFLKSGLGQSSARKQLMTGHMVADNSRGLLQWIQSISFVSVSVDHSLQLVCQSDTSPGTTPNSGFLGQPGYLEGYTPVKSLGSASASYILIPSPSMRFLPPSPLQLPTCLTAESPPLAHLLHSKGSAIPLSTGFVVSKSVPSMRKNSKGISKEEWPSVLSVSLVDHYGSEISQEKMSKGVVRQGGRKFSSEGRDFESVTHAILETLAAELHALSWMTVSPAYPERRSALPFHCDMVLRLRRLLHFADKELSR